MFNATLKVGLFLCALTFFNGGQSQAITSSDKSESVGKPLQFSASSNAFILGPIENPANSKEKAAETDKTIAAKPAATPAEKKPIQHIIAEGESLTMIAKKHNSLWMRLFSKNIQITHPDLLTVGDKLIIPLSEEKLPERALPASQPVATAVTSASALGSENSAPALDGGSAVSAGNTYYAGYCTWYAKNRRPDLPNSLGNANEWVGKAQTLGLATGSSPRVGAIGQQGMHVVYIESVNGDGFVTISEMNYQGLHVTSSRTVPAGNFAYIY